MPRPFKEQQWNLGSVELLSLGLIYCAVLVCAQLDNYNWPENTPVSIKNELHIVGKEVRLKCALKERFRSIQRGLNITWEFKPCRLNACTHKHQEGEWIPVCGEHVQRQCRSVLLLRKPNEEDSGLYRCQINFEMPVTINIFQLEFIAQRRDPPVIVGDAPTNTSVVAPSLAVMSCRVQSTLPPIIRWFHKLDVSPLQSPLPHNFIQYLNNTYELLDCCPTAILSQIDMYLSKLILHPTSMIDSGFYICLAINDAGYTYREAYLNVQPLVRAPGEKVETTSFLLLFLIPIGLCMIPVSAWLLCLRKRKDSEEDVQQEDRTHRTQNSNSSTSSSNNKNNNNNNSIHQRVAYIPVHQVKANNRQTV